MHELKTIQQTKKLPKRYCQQCGRDLGNAWLLGPVCIKCVRKNHRDAVRGKR